MNFVERQVGEAAPRNFAASEAVRKWPIRFKSIEAFAICIDLATILLASVLSALLYHIDSGWTATDIDKAVGSAIIASALFVCLLKIYGKYRPTELLVMRDQIQAVLLAWTFVLLLLASAVAALKISNEVSRGTGLIFALLGFAMLSTNRAIIRALLRKGLSARRFAGSNIVLITDQPQSHHAGLAQTLATFGFCVTGRFSLPPPGAGFGYRKRLSRRVIEHTRDAEIEEIVVETDPSRWSELREFVAELRVLPFPVVFVPAGAASDMFKRPTRPLGSAVCIELQRRPLTFAECAIKRSIDVIGAGLALIIFLPLLVVVALAIKLDSRGPILFKQRRCGFNRCSFSIYKFRTMFVLEDGPSIIQARPADSRVTRVGKWLRQASIDELPQLFNVLNGSMSLVGPRPHAVAHDGQFDKAVRNYAFRRRVKPGLTGWAQIHGCRGSLPTAAAIERRVEYDLWYIDNWSLRLDLTILIQTPIEVLRARNAY
jgi:putative colanic acid biosynthesis UDP-glucose lipid carrier transferase